MKQLACALMIIGMVSPILTERVRSRLHKHRQQKDGLGGTQDIAICGTSMGLIGMIGGGILLLFDG